MASNLTAGTIDASNGKPLNVDMAELKGKGLQTIKQAEEYALNINKMYDEIHSLEERKKWSDSASRSFVTQIEGYRKDIEALGDIFSDYGKFLINASKIYDDTKNSILSAAKKL